MAINSQQKPYLIPFIIIFLTIVANPFIKLSDSAGTMFDLIHRDHLSGRQHLTLAERVKQMLYRDMIHVQRIQTHFHNKQQQQQQQNVGLTVVRRGTLEGERVAISPIRSGYDERTGEYFVEIMVGTPAKKFLVVADTGSDLTWLDCNYKGINQNPHKVVFDADHSTSFKTITCSSSTCRNDLAPLFSLPDKCPHPNDNCLYNYSYVGKSTAAQGIFAHETLTFNLTDGTTSTTTNTLIGCTNSTQGLDSFLSTNAVIGIMGLGNTPFSLQNQISNLFGQKFSYCLVDLQSHNITSSKLFFGSPPQETIKINGTMQNTKLELVKAKPYYGVNVKSISINGTLLDIPASAWSFNSDGGGTIIGSGSTLTSLIDTAYGPVSNALNKSLSSLTRAKGPPFDLCYTSKGLDENAAPEVEIEFVDGAKLVVPGKNYLLGVGPGIKCVAFVKVSTTSGVNIIGNLMQQNNLWEFDTKNAILRFGSSSCT